MNRRQLVVGTASVIGAVTGGCLATPERSTGEFRRRTTISETDAVPKEAPVHFELEVTDGHITEAGTAFVEFTATNTSASEITISPYYKGRSAFDGQPGILLYALEAADSPPEDYTPACIDDPAATEDGVYFTEEGPPMYALDPDDSVTVRYIVVDDPSVDGCFPPAEYRFESQYLFDEVDVRWGFAIEIADASSTGDVG